MLTATNYKYRNLTTSKVACFISVDPKIYEFPFQSSYVYAGNNPIKYIDVNGEFKFDPATLKMLKREYPHVYAFLTSDKGLALIAKNPIFQQALIDNTYYANLEYKGEFNNKIMGGIPDVNEGDKTFELTGAKIEMAFSPNNGPYIKFNYKPGGADSPHVESSGYNEWTTGDDNLSPNKNFEINKKYLDIIENIYKNKDERVPQSTKNKRIEEAFINLSSSIGHEYLEYYSDDNIVEFPDDEGNIIFRGCNSWYFPVWKDITKEDIEEIRKNNPDLIPNIIFE